MYDFIEIGTSDFETLLEKCGDETGLSIEPISEYLDALPNKPNVKKINAAVSNKIGELLINYIRPQDIIKYGLPDFVKGCNSINSFHPTIVNLLLQNNLSLSLITSKKVRVIDWSTLVRENNIKGCKYLKTDTEGHDCVILNNLIDYCENGNQEKFPKKITFESNILSNSADIDLLLERFYKNGYTLVYRNHDTCVERLYLKY